MTETLVKSYHGGRYEIRSDLRMEQQIEEVLGDYKNIPLLLILTFISAFGFVIAFKATMTIASWSAQYILSPTQSFFLSVGYLSAIIPCIIAVPFKRVFRREISFERMNVYVMDLRLYSRTDVNDYFLGETELSFSFLPGENISAYNQTKDTILKLESVIEALELRKNKPYQIAQLQEELISELKEIPIVNVPVVNEPKKANSDNRFTDIDTNDYND